MAQSSIDPSGSSQYQFTTIDAPGASDTEAYGINNPGIVTGFYVIQGRGHGFVWRNGSLTTVDHPGALDTLLGDVNDPGLVIGNYGPFETQHATIYNIATGTFTTLPDVPNLPVNIGDGINAQGIAVGSAGMGNVSVTFSNVGWIWDGRAYSFFSVPGSAGFGTTAGGINARGQVSGYFQDASGGFHGFLKHGSTFTQIDVPGATDTFAYAINNRTDLAGWYVDQQGVTHGFVLSGGMDQQGDNQQGDNQQGDNQGFVLSGRKFTTIDVPGSLGTMVTGINEKGELAGLWFAANATHAFIASRH
jgi:hypothetical protein